VVFVVVLVVVIVVLIIVMMIMVVMVTIPLVACPPAATIPIAVAMPADDYARLGHDHGCGPRSGLDVDRATFDIVTRQRGCRGRCGEKAKGEASCVA
jgi:hypothetical protein